MSTSPRSGWTMQCPASGHGAAPGYPRSGYVSAGRRPPRPPARRAAADPAAWPPRQARRVRGRAAWSVQPLHLEVDTGRRSRVGRSGAPSRRQCSSAQMGAGRCGHRVQPINPRRGEVARHHELVVSSAAGRTRRAVRAAPRRPVQHLDRAGQREASRPEYPPPGRAFAAVAPGRSALRRSGSSAGPAKRRPAGPDRPASPARRPRHRSPPDRAGARRRRVHRTSRCAARPGPAPSGTVAGAVRSSARPVGSLRRSDPGRRSR